MKIGLAIGGCLLAFDIRSVKGRREILKLQDGERSSHYIAWPWETGMMRAEEQV